MFDMGFFNKYPYTDFHELNLDWLIRALKEYAEELQNFVLINAIKYADPIQWDITRQYEKNTVVVDPLTGIAYISVAAVPSGIALSRTEYWTVIFDLSRFINAANDNFTVRVETSTTTTATFNTAAGEWLIWDQKLYRANVNITAGDAYVENSNITRITAEEMLQEVATDLQTLTAAVGDLADLTTTDKSSIVNAINELVTGIAGVVNSIGDLADLTTTDKSSIVNAINDVVSALTTAVNAIGDLSSLTTTDKSSIVNAINELVSSIAGAVSSIGDLADLTTTDKSSIVNAINELVTSLSTLSGNVGNLADLTTTDKSSIVNAINELAATPAGSSFVTPEDFGAVGDGVTDDTAAFDAAIATGGPVYVDAKDYKLTTLNIANARGLIIFGTGKRTVLHVDNIVITGCNDVQLRNMIISANGNTTDLINVSSSYHVIFDDVNTTANGYLVQSGFTFDGSAYCYYCAVMNGTAAHFKAGATFKNSANANVVQNNEFLDDEVCISIDSCNGLNILSNHFQSYLVKAILMNWTSGSATIGNLITGNYFEGANVGTLAGDIDCSNSSNVAANFIVGNHMTYRNKPHVFNNTQPQTILDFNAQAYGDINQIPGLYGKQLFSLATLNDYAKDKLIGGVIPVTTGGVGAVQLALRTLLKNESSELKWATLINASPQDDRDVKYYCTRTSDEMFLQTLRSGTTSQRTTWKCAGYCWFDTTLGKPIWQKELSGSSVVWVDATGAVV